MITLRAESASAAMIESDGDEAVVRHSHYYDAALHRAITETGNVNGRETLERAAASAAFRSLVGSVAKDPSNELATLFVATGLGTIQRCETTTERAEIAVSPSSFVQARLEMFGKATAPTCDIARGVVAGALGALHGSKFNVREVACVATGAKSCRFVAERVGVDEANVVLTPFEWPARGVPPEPDTFAPSADLLGAVTSMDNGGTSGVTHGKLWAELYARATCEFEEAVPEAMGAKFNNLASVVLTEAAHLGTFYSVGGLLRSEEWRQRVIPVVPSREDWVHALIALVDSFGWGSWRVRLLAPEQRFTVHVYDGYEALSYLALNGAPASSPRCYFSRGFVGGLMNLLFGGDVLTPTELNQGVYNTLFRSPSSFRAMETRCQAMGHPYCEFVANPLSPGLRRN